MIISTPYTECFIKKSFLTDNPIYTEDDTIFAVIFGIRFIRARAPLFLCYIPSIGALYDKVDQCAIFNTENTPKHSISMTDVAWWDCLSDSWQLVQIQAMKNMDVIMYTRNNDKREGTYLWTCDPQRLISDNDYGQGEVWHEHKTKTFFFDEDTGVLCCAPNNKMRLYDSSLCPEKWDSPSWLKVYKDSYDYNRTTHENNLSLGNTNNSFTYKK